jgi:lipopolysaccharide export system protein LptA
VFVLAFQAAAVDRKDPEREDVKVSPKKPVEVNADELTFDRESGRTVFKGKVHVLHDKIDLGADEVRAVSGNRQATAEGGVTVVDGSMSATLSCGHLDYLDQMRIISAHEKPHFTTVDDDDQPVTLDGRQIEFYSEQKMALANQDVVLFHPRGKATAGRATYLKGENRVILEQEPKVFNEYGDVTGRRMTAYLGEHRLVVEGDVSATFYPTPQPSGGSITSKPGPPGKTSNKPPVAGDQIANPTSAPAHAAVSGTPTPVASTTPAPGRSLGDLIRRTNP